MALDFSNSTTPGMSCLQNLNFAKRPASDPNRRRPIANVHEDEIAFVLDLNLCFVGIPSFALKLAAKLHKVVAQEASSSAAMPPYKTVDYRTKSSLVDLPNFQSTIDGRQRPFAVDGPVRLRDASILFAMY